MAITKFLVTGYITRLWLWAHSPGHFHLLADNSTGSRKSNWHERTGNASPKTRGFALPQSLSLPVGDQIRMYAKARGQLRQHHLLSDRGKHSLGLELWRKITSFDHQRRVSSHQSDSTLPYCPFLEVHFTLHVRSSRSRPSLRSLNFISSTSSFIIASRIRGLINADNSSVCRYSAIEEVMPRRTAG